VVNEPYVSLTITPCRSPATGSLTRMYHQDIFRALEEQDGEIFQLINREYDGCKTACSLSPRRTSVPGGLGGSGLRLQNKTTEGFPAPVITAAARSLTRLRIWPSQGRRRPSRPVRQRAAPLRNHRQPDYPHGAAGAGDKILSLAWTRRHLSHGRGLLHRQVL